MQVVRRLYSSYIYNTSAMDCGFMERTLDRRLKEERMCHSVAETSWKELRDAFHDAKHLVTNPRLIASWNGAVFTALNKRSVGGYAVGGLIRLAQPPNRNIC